MMRDNVVLNSDVVKLLLCIWLFDLKIGIKIELLLLLSAAKLYVFQNTAQVLVLVCHLFKMHVFKLLNVLICLFPLILKAELVVLLKVRVLILKIANLSFHIVILLRVSN